MKRIVSLILGLAGVFVGLGIALPALAKLKSYGAISSCGLLFAGLVIATGGVGSAAYGLRKRSN